MATDAEDEWEYEYDENETEDFYITLDLSNVPDRGTGTSLKGGAVRPSLSGHPTLLQSRLRQLATARRLEEDSIDPITGASSLGTIQITGLHTDNPLVVYDNDLISCNWGSAIGTDMFFVKPNPDAEEGDEPLKSLPGVDLLAISSAKLMGTGATLRPSDEVLEKVPLEDEAEGVRSDGKDAEENQPTSTDKSRPVPANSFLAKLNEAKAKRGDKSRLMLSENGKGSRLVAAHGNTDGNEPEDVEMGGVEKQT